MRTKSATFALRLPESLKDAVEKAAREDGTSMNQFIVIAAAEKLSALNTAAFFAERGRNGDFDELLRILNRKGGEPPRPGDELPEDWMPSPRER